MEKIKPDIPNIQLIHEKCTKNFRISELNPATKKKKNILTTINI